MDAEPTLQEPHFDEEATVLSARPVVPLAAVEAARAKTSFPRPWLLAFGLVGALVVGISATVIYYSRPSGNDSNLFQDTEIAAGVEGKSTEPANGFGGAAAPRPKVDIDSPAQVKRETLGNQADRASAEEDKKPRPRLVAVIREKKSNNHTEEEGPEDRKAARKQARQERRRAEREKRDGKSTDELLRIRDIFEGSPRP